ncbi:DUF4328 domain-containing protein [Streptomyces sp. NPDC005562]|uniref:DUF4328 domain-containing protein n=1 Tax=unclassified Streptomyces TaxID=2593676 RepID=UPI0033BA82E6
MLSKDHPPPHVPAGRPAHLRSPVGLSRAVIALLAVVVAADLYSLWAGTVMRGVMDDLISGDYGAGIEREADRADTLYAASGFLQTGALLATCVVFLVWFHRVRVNAEVFEPFIHRKTRGWAVGGWFVPVANLWFPRRIALDIWDASGPRSVALDRSMTLDPRAGAVPHRLLNAWWTLWVVNLLAGRWSTQSYWRAEEPHEIRDAVGNLMFSDVVDIASAVLAMVFVHRLTRLQDDKARSGPPRDPALP